VAGACDPGAASQRPPTSSPTEPNRTVNCEIDHLGSAGDLAAVAGNVSISGVAIVSASSEIAATSSLPAESPRSTNPFKSPTYPPRIHFSDQQELEATLQSCDAKLLAVSQKLTVLGKNPKRAEYERAYFQLQGARDQVAECVRRLPLETGALYDEDRERLTEAVKAFTRVIKTWDTIL
jgi:hypothetical protein